MSQEKEEKATQYIPVYFLYSTWDEFVDDEGNLTPYFSTHNYKEARKEYYETVKEVWGTIRLNFKEKILRKYYVLRAKLGLRTRYPGYGATSCESFIMEIYMFRDIDTQNKKIEGIEVNKKEIKEEIDDIKDIVKIEKIEKLNNINEAKATLV